MDKKGFTLIELMAVLIILAFVALITVPAITKVIAKQKKNAFVINSKNLLDTMKADYLNNYDGNNVNYSYYNNKLTSNIEGKVEMNNVPFDGKIILGVGNAKFYFANGETIVQYAIHDENWCVRFDQSNNELKSEEYNGSCDING